MSDPRYEKLAHTLVHYACTVEPGEKVLIEAIDAPHAFTNRLVRTVAAAGGHPVVLLKSVKVQRELLLAATPEQLDLLAESEEAIMRQVAAYIAVRGSDNVSELADVPPEKIRLYEERYYERVHFKIRVPHTRWVVTRWPSPSMAQLAQLSTEAFEDFYFRVCTLDYARLSRAMVPLKDYLERTDRVRLVAPGTDLTLSVKGIPSVLCDGHRNIPDGEVFTAPVRDSAHGTITFNAPTIYQGVTHERVRLTFRDGRIVEAVSSDSAALDRVLDTDEGARYPGEFAFGLNPHITRPMKDILFDEKIAGSIHLTPGQCYKEAANGNQSKIHWDLVLLMDPANGGGEVYFDDRLVRKDGRFVVPELEPLNPEHLA